MRIDVPRVLPLLAVTALPAAVEAAVLRAVDFRSAVGLSPLISAPMPYASLHDMLWLLVYHSSWLGFVAELVAAILFRAVLGAAAVAMVWPADVPRPRLRVIFWRNLVFAGFCAAIMSPGAAFAIAGVAVSLSWLVVGEFLPLLLLAPLLQRGGIWPGWWRGLPTLRVASIAWLNFVVLTWAGVMVWLVPGWWAVPVAAVAGAVNAPLWWLVVRAAVGAPVRLRRLPAVPVMLGILALSLIVIGNGLGFGSGGEDRSAPQPVAGMQAQQLRREVVYIDGYDSAYSGGPTESPLLERFSYRGLGPDGKPLPYEPIDTHQSLDTSAARLAAHVDDLHRRTGRPVALLGLSEGALVVRKYLDTRPHPNVDAAAMISPVVRPGQVYYPPPQADKGWGLAAGWELRVLFALVEVRHRVPINPDEPFIRSLLAEAPQFRNQLLCPVPGVRMIAFLPSADAATIPEGEFSGIPIEHLPSVHGGLVGWPTAQRHLVGFFNGTDVPSTHRIDYPLVQLATGVWQAPVLALSVNPVWHRAGQPDAAFRGQACP